ncbi:MAG TPA: Na-translocating system protein MpsB, partial [Haliscomenobacter sp.]|nr:Na-translocating system protein MpsB [Haliscomenobacter sp.]
LKQSHSSIGGWLISQTLGFWAGLRLFLNIFRPSMGPATASSLKHMDKYSKLTIECGEHPEKVNGLQVGYSIDEMVTRVETVLRSIGLIKDFAPLVYIVGHGASSVNNPYYAAYDCGACSGRAGSVNARVFSYMANHPEVRSKLAEKGLLIPVETQFVGALHDTTRDEIVFYDEFSLPPAHFELHTKNEVVFEKALDYNAKERSRRFYTVDTHKAPIKVHEKVLSRSVSLFEPRPELNHATNALCIIGGRNLSRGLFLDRRAFLNSYDYRQDPEGIYLSTILDAAAPVCGGINLEYFFSRVDEQKLGAGSKLPHNVMGLFGVANGIDGDLRPGLPTQMTEVHDPLRLLMIVEHHPELVLKSLLRSAATYEWFINEWINLIVVHPETREFYRFKDGTYTLYEPLQQDVPMVNNLNALIETHTENLPVHLIPQN